MQQVSFAQFLVGSKSAGRPLFFQAYSGIWLHLIIAVPIAIFVFDAPMPNALCPLVIGSLSMGIILYGAFTRQYELLVNVLPYTLSIGCTIDPANWTPIFQIIGMIITFAAGYMILAHQYRCYVEEAASGKQEHTFSAWNTFFATATLLLMFFHGVRLL